MREHLTNKLSVYILVAMLGGLMSYYYFVFVPQNEQHLTEYANRLLNNKARSIIEKYDGYSNAIATAPKAYFLKWYFDTHPGKTSVNVKQVNDTLTFSESSLSGSKSISFDTYKKALVDNNFLSDVHDEVKKSTPLHEDDEGNFHFVFKPKGQFINHAAKKSVSPQLSLQVMDFTSNLKSNNFFDDLFLVSLPSATDKEDGLVLDSSRLGLMHFTIPDTVQQFGTGAYSKKLSGQFYKAYIKNVTLGQGMEVYIVGLVAESKLHQLGREVPTWFVVFCLLATLLVIFLYPVIKIFTINHHERLSASDARLSIYSMILFLSLTTILLVGSYIFIGLDNKRIDDEIKSYANTIAYSTKAETDALHVALQDLGLFSQDNATKNMEQFKAMHEDITKFNEVFSLRLNDEGEQKAGSTKELFVSEPAEFDLNTFPVEVSSRDYFQLVREAIKNKQPVDYVLQSINSYTTGRSEAALSIPWQNETVRVITSRLPSVIRAVLPAPYKFVVLDKTGEVKFHSEWTELQSENFISECDNDFKLSTFLNNNIEDYISFTYLRNDCRGYCRPLVKDWKVLVYYEVHESRSLAAEIFSLCLISLALVIICTGLIHFALMQDRKSSGLLKTKTFFYHWLNPLRGDSKQWLYLFAFGLLLLLVEMLWLTFFQSITASILLVFIVITLFYTVLYGQLNRKHVRPELSTSMVMLISFAVIWFIGFIIVSRLAHQYENVCFVLAASLIVFLLMKSIRKLRQPDWLKGISNYLAYRLFIITALLVIAVAPAWIFISEHYYYSSLAHQYSLAFADIKKSQITSVYHQSEQLGKNYISHQLNASEDVQDKPFNHQHIDFAFYSFLQDLQLTTKSMAELKFSMLPTEPGYELFYSADKLKVKAPHSLIAEGYRETITHDRKINRLEWKSELTDVFSYLFFTLLVLMIVLWYIIKHLPRKIFFAPDKIVWNSLPERKMEQFIEREFENDDDDRHPLHRIRPEDKQKLIRDYKTAMNKLTDESVKLLIRDRYILKLQELAKDDYAFTWKDCEKEEKYLVYDLSVDGVTNQADQVLIGQIAEKGLIRLAPRLEPVNRSFANFVLNSMDEKELTTWREKEDKEGNWSNLRLMLIIIVATAFVFLSMAEEGFAGRVSALLASVGLIFPRLITIVTSFGDLFKTKPPV